MNRAQRFTLKRYSSLDDMKMDEFAYWQGRPGHERLKAASDVSSRLYAAKHGSVDVSGLRRSLARERGTEESGN